MAAIDKCRAEIAAALGRKEEELSDRELGAISRQAAKIKARLDAANGNPEVARTIMQNFLDDRARILQDRKTMAAATALKAEQQRARIEASGKFKMQAPGQVLQSMVIESLKDFPGAKDSLGSAITHSMDERLQTYFTDLQAQKLDKIAFAEANDKSIRLAFAALSAGKDASAFGPDNVKVAALLKKHTDALWLDKKAEGIPQGKLEDWGGPQIHDPWSLARAGGHPYGSRAAAEAWAKDVLNTYRLDWGKTFGGEFLAQSAAEREKRLIGIHSQFVSHNHLKYGAADPGKSREFHFESPETAYAYHQKYGGNRTLAEDVAGHLRYGARDVAIAREWGPRDLETSMKAVLDPWEKQLADAGNGKAANDFRRVKDKVFKQWLPSMTGGLADPEHAATQYLQAFRTVVDTLVTAGSLPVLLGDTPLKMRLMEQNGGRSMQGYMRSMGKTLDRFNSMSKDERYRTASRLSVLLQDAQIPLSHASLQWSGFGKVNRFSQWAQKYYGHTPVTDRFRLNMATAFGQDHWMDRGKSFAELSPGQQSLFRQFGIDDKGWDILKQQTDTIPLGKNQEAFAPDAIRRMELEKFKSMAGADASDAALKRTRNSLADKYRNLIGEMADRGTSVPSESMKAISIQGTSEGSPLGQLVRMNNALKNFTYNLMRNHLGQMIYGDSNPDNVGWGKAMYALMKGNGGWQPGRVGFIKFMANSVAFGVLINAIDDVRDGNTPQNIFDPAQTKDVLIRGFMRQSFGLYSDFLIGQMDHPDQPMLETFAKGMAGPTLEKASDIGTTITRTLAHVAKYEADPNADPEKFARALGGDMNQVVKTGYGMIPGNNFTWTKAVTDRYLYDNIQDWVNPGYKERLQARLAKRGQTQILP